MKRVMLAAFLLATSADLFSGVATITYLQSNNTFSHADFKYCDNPPAKNFYITYDGCPGIYPKSICKSGGLGANPYRFTVELRKDGQVIDTRTNSASSMWINLSFPITAPEGSYSGHVKLEKRVFIATWKTIDNLSTNTIKSERYPPKSNFNINGLTSSSINVDDSEPLILDGSASLCVPKYFVSVQLSDVSWNRFGPEATAWLTDAEAKKINHFDVRDFAVKHGVTIRPGEYYRVKLAVGNPWHDQTKLVYIIPNPNVVKLRHKSTGNCLYGSEENAGPVRNWGCWDDPNMAFVVEDLGNNEVRLRHRGPGKCIYSNPNDGGPAKNWACWNDPYMVFILDDLGNSEIRLRSKKTGKCLYGDPKNGELVRNWGCWNDPNMVFVMDSY